MSGVKIFVWILLITYSTGQDPVEEAKNKLKACWVNHQRSPNGDCDSKARNDALDASRKGNSYALDEAVEKLSCPIGVSCNHGKCGDCPTCPPKPEGTPTSCEALWNIHKDLVNKGGAVNVATTGFTDCLQNYKARDGDPCLMSDIAADKAAKQPILDKYGLNFDTYKPISVDAAKISLEDHIKLAKLDCAEGLVCQDRKCLLCGSCTEKMVDKTKTCESEYKVVQEKAKDLQTPIKPAGAGADSLKQFNRALLITIVSSLGCIGFQICSF